MLSLGYPKINFQAANSLVKAQFLQTVTETVASVKQTEKHKAQTTTAAPQVTKEQAFQVL